MTPLNFLPSKLSESAALACQSFGDDLEISTLLPSTLHCHITVIYAFLKLFCFEVNCRPTAASTTNVECASTQWTSIDVTEGRRVWNRTSGLEGKELHLLVRKEMSVASSSMALL